MQDGRKATSSDAADEWADQGADGGSGTLPWLPGADIIRPGQRPGSSCVSPLCSLLQALS